MKGGRFTFININHNGVIPEYSHAWTSKFDLIYIDASHTREGIKNDTELALDLMSQNGTIIWDDYNGWWAGVDEYLDELALSDDLIYLLDNRYVILSLDK